MAPLAPKKQKVTIILDDSDEELKVSTSRSKNMSVLKEKILFNPSKEINRAVRAMSVLSIATSCTLGVESDEDCQPEPLPQLQSLPTPNPRKRPRHDESGANVIRRHVRSQAPYPETPRQVLDAHAANDEEEDDVVFVREQKRQKDHVYDIERAARKGLIDLEEEVFGARQPSENQHVEFSQNITVEPPFVKLEDCNLKGQVLRPDMSVELYSGYFLEIKVIVKNLQNDEVILKGWQMKRSSMLSNMLEKKINELCYIFDINLEDERDVKEQGMVEYKLDCVSKIRTVIRTNMRREKTPWIGHHQDGESKEQAMKRIREHEKLYLRRKFTRVWPTAQSRVQRDTFPNRFKTKRIESLTEKECDPGMFASSDCLRTDWRGKTKLGGSGEGEVADRQGRRSSKDVQKSEREHQKKRETIERDLEALGDSENIDPLLYQKILQISGSLKIDEDRKSTTKKTAGAKIQHYTYGDTFSGGGGSTRAAKIAGFGIKYVMDGDIYCIPTLEANFSTAKVYHEWSNVFATRRDDLKVDLLHLSPPCQVWSPAHTIPGQNDEQNFASLFAVMALLNKIKPRMATLEQTFGITAKRFEVPFHSLIHAFTSLGYSVSWQIVKFQELGLPQMRKRLIMVAAGPGEILPEFPQATHSNSRGPELKSFTTPGSVLRAIPFNAPNHDIREASHRRNGIPWNDSNIIKCITTGGGSYSSYPDGSRGLTLREFAALQGFPNYHEFMGNKTSIKKQIGNAVPPLVAKVWCEHIRKHLEQQDRLELVNARKE